MYFQFLVSFLLQYKFVNMQHIDNDSTLHGTLCGNPNLFLVNLLLSINKIIIIVIKTLLYITSKIDRCEILNIIFDYVILANHL